MVFLSAMYSHKATLKLIKLAIIPQMLNLQIFKSFGFVRFFFPVKSSYFVVYWTIFLNDSLNIRATTEISLQFKMFLKIQLDMTVKEGRHLDEMRISTGIQRDCTYSTSNGKLLFAFVLIVRKINLYCLLCLEKVSPNIPLCQGLVIWGFFSYLLVQLSLFKFFLIFLKTVQICHKQILKLFQ